MFEIFKKKSVVHNMCFVSWLGGFFLATGLVLLAAGDIWWTSLIVMAIGLTVTIIASLNLKYWSRKKMPEEWREELRMAPRPDFDGTIKRPITKGEFNLLVEVMAPFFKHDQLKL